MSQTIEAGIREAKINAREEGGLWCVVKRLDRRTREVREFAAAPIGVALDDTDSIVWSQSRERLASEGKA